MSDKLVLGVDIGGTKVAAGLVNSAGRIVAKTRVPMNAAGTATQALECVHQAIDKALALAPAKEKVSAIGLSSPGPLDPHSGIVLHTPNLPCWINFALRTFVEERYKLPVRLDNDANAAGLAEAIWGAGAGHNSVFYVTVGTGVGTAIILNRQVLYGRTGTAAEGGHMTIDFRAPVRCGCGKRGCLESMASGPAMALRGQAAVTNDGASGAALLALADGEISQITAEFIVNASRSGDPLARKVLQETVDLLTIWLGNVVDLLEPDVIVIGGGLGSQITDWYDGISAALPKWSINARASEIPMVPAKYGADAGIAGSAALWLREQVHTKAAAELD
ncbi:MAG: ROK family protein [Terriglobales bacterium]